MTWPDFWWDVASNTIATALGVIAGLPAGFWLERLIDKRRQHSDAQRRRADLRTLVDVLGTSIDANISAIEVNENELSAGRQAIAAGVELFTWDALQPR